MMAKFNFNNLVITAGALPLKQMVKFFYNKHIVTSVYYYKLLAYSILMLYQKTPRNQRTLPPHQNISSGLRSAMFGYRRCSYSHKTDRVLAFHTCSKSSGFYIFHKVFLFDLSLFPTTDISVDSTLTRLNLVSSWHHLQNVFTYSS
jgi:hypothetical protein